MNSKQWAKAADSIESRIIELREAVVRYRANADAGVPWPHLNPDQYSSVSQQRLNASERGHDCISKLSHGQGKSWLAAMGALLSKLLHIRTSHSDRYLKRA